MRPPLSLFVPLFGIVLFGVLIASDGDLPFAGEDLASDVSVESPAPLSGKDEKVDPRDAVPPQPNVDKSPLPLPGTMTSEEYQALLYKFLSEREYIKLGWAPDKKVRDTGPYIDNTSYGTHEACRIWYSPEVIEWLEKDRAIGIPDGAMIIKEMFTPPAARYDSITGGQLDSMVAGWAVMVRDSSASKDGWYWSYYGPGQAVDDPNKYPYDYPNSGFGQYCVRCHASAESEMTFSHLANIKGYPGEPIVFRVDNSWVPGQQLKTESFSSHPQLAAALTPGQKRAGASAPARRLNAEFAEQFDQIPVIPAHDVLYLPSVGYDHVYAGAAGPEQFLTSDQCMSCHDGQGLPFGPNMYIPSEDGKNVNLSPYGEWNWSMMGLAGRDPIFYSQLESEIRLYPSQAATIQNLCFTCHGVMGQRQLTIDHPGRLFNVSIPYEKDYNSPDYKYGALARDGISCTVCHQIVDDGLPLDSIVTGRFKVSTPGEFEEGISYIYGPFEDPRVLAMESSLGMKPVQSDYIKSSRLCGSCHSVKLPVFDANGNTIGEVFEQATYLEWQNSAYQNDFKPWGATPKTCQNCHMPGTYPYLPDDYQGTEKAQDLAFRISNIQDQTYPEVESRAPIDSIDIAIRPDFVRHTLLGINLFGLEMFNQFDDILGVRKQDYMTYSKNGLPFAIEAGNRLAKSHTARVEVQDVQKTRNGLKATVKVTSLVGHRFPSGVGFRRAFLEFQVVDNMNTVIWSSGSTNSLGVIVDGEGRVLPSEFLDMDQSADTQYYQPHYQTITRQDQVQIYQELAKNSQGKFTTSFLGIAEHVKDNRLLPNGWSPKGPPGFEYAEWTMPHGNALRDKDFTNGTGSDVITYDVTLPAGAAKGARVIARLYYQSIPPYYLRDRFTIAADGQGTQRLHYLASHLQTQGTPIENWKLLVSGDSKGL